MSDSLLSGKLLDSLFVSLLSFTLSNKRQSKICYRENPDPGLSIGFEVDGDILKVDSYGGRRPPHKRGVWGRLTPPAGNRGRAPLGVEGVKPPEAK